MCSEHVRRQCAGGVLPGMRDMSGARAVVDRSGPQIMHRATNLIPLQEIDPVPPGQVPQLRWRRRVIPGYKVVASGEQLNEVAPHKAGCARDQRRTRHAQTRFSYWAW